MKSKIHPQYFEDTKVICACGHTFITGSTKQSLMVDVCSKCHPLYTGEHRFVDTKGKVESFKRKQKIAAEIKKKLPPKRERKEAKEHKHLKSLRELLAEG